MKFEYDKNNVWHVTPVDDIQDHAEKIDCSCHPKLEVQDNGGLVVVHNSWDGRELEEKGIKPN